MKTDGAFSSCNIICTPVLVGVKDRICPTDISRSFQKAA
ncbi:hypothetical protein CU037_1007 [Enterococcus faecium]|nr:hypothetical protein [Enterococcus faecium]